MDLSVRTIILYVRLAAGWKIWIIFPVTALSRKHPQILMVKSRIVSCSSMASAMIAYKILLPWLQCIEIVCA